MNYECIQLEVSQGIATIELHRPEKRNAYTPDMGEELVHAIRAALADDAVLVLILTAAGAGFCAGADREYLAGKTGRSGLRIGEETFITEFSAELSRSCKPLIAAINGPAIGIGVTMLLPFDMRIAAREAVFGFPFTRLGLVPGLGGTYFLNRLVGYAKAAELVFCDTSIDAQEALAIGLVNKVVALDELRAAARELALRVAKSPPAAIAAAKRALTFAAGASLESAMVNERRENDGLRATREANR